LTNDFFVNLLDMGHGVEADVDAADTYRGLHADEGTQVRPPAASMARVRIELPGSARSGGRSTCVRRCARRSSVKDYRSAGTKVMNLDPIFGTSPDSPRFYRGVRPSDGPCFSDTTQLRSSDHRSRVARPDRP
jgi:hypothetical protein